MISDACRLRAKNALRSKLNREENITVFEKYIHQMYGDNDDEYLNNTFQIVYDVNTTNMSDVLKDLKEGKYGWHHKSLDTYRDIEYEQDAFIIQPFDFQLTPLLFHNQWLIFLLSYSTNVFRLS